MALPFFVLFGFGTLAVSDQKAPQVESNHSISWSDLSGRKYGLEDIRRSRATVFFFTSTKCPISNLYVPRMAEIAEAYQARAVQFFLVNANQEDSASEVEK